MFEKAKWIWVGENYKSEIYSDFYADFKIEFTSPDLLNKNLILNVAAENDYAAYLNGKLVSFNAFKGYPDLKFFNSAVLNDFLNEGKNELVFIVWHEGVNTSRSINSGAGVIFEGVLVEKNSEKPAYNSVNGTFAQESRKSETLFFSDKNGDTDPLVPVLFDRLDFPLAHADRKTVSFAYANRRAGNTFLPCITQRILGDLFQLIACINEIGINHDDYLIEGIVKAVMIAAKHK